MAACLFTGALVGGSRSAHAQATPFGTLQAPFTQKLYAVTTGFVGGVAFDPAGNVVVDNCVFNGGSLTRFDAASTVVVHGSTIHPGTAIASGAGCGLVLGPDSFLYSNTGGGVTKLDPTAGTVLATSGAPGNALGIAVDPQTHNLAYVDGACSSGSGCPIDLLDPVAGTTTKLITLTNTSFADGIAFDPTGTYLFISTRAPLFAVTVVRRDGTLVQQIPMPSEPDGISFHASAPKFVVTDNTDGTMTRLDFPGDDYTQTPTLSSFASGGFRGDLSGVGPDGCIYVPQDGTRYADGTTTTEDSIIQICPGFAPTTPPADTTAPTCTVGALTQSGSSYSVTFTVQDSGSGLEMIVPTTTNFSVAIPSFTPATTASTNVVATVSNAQTNGSVSLVVTDAAGNSTTCSATFTAPSHGKHCCHPRKHGRHSDSDGDCDGD